MTNCTIETSQMNFITRSELGGNKDVFRIRLFIPSPLLHRVMAWLQARFSEAVPEPVADESKPSEIAKLQEEMMKNKKRMKSMMAMMEAQNKLLRSLALRIDPAFGLPEGTEETWGMDGTDGRNPTSLDAGKESEVPTDDTSVDLAKEDKASDALFESGL